MNANTPPLSVEERARLTSGADTWHTESHPAIAPALMLSDGPHGIRQQRQDGDALGIGDSVPATCFPPAVALGSSWDPDLAERVGRALGEEARAQGVHVLLGPGMNIKRSPLGGRNFEYLSEDPHLTGKLAAALVRGIQSQRVAATPKHFAVNNQETDRMRISADLDERTLREIYLRAFEMVVTQSRPWALMSAYNRIDGTFASEAHWLLTKILREEWGFDGLVMSDWGAVADRAASLAAGLDLEMPPSGTDSRIVEAVSRGELSEDVLDRAVQRLRTLAERVDLARTDGYDADAHHALATEAAAESIVLLRNSGILPLDPETVGTVAVIGSFAAHPRYQGGGSSRVVPTRLTGALEEITALVGDRAVVTHAPGFAEEGDLDALREEAVSVAREADVAVFFAGLPEHAESEGFDREDIELPRAQVAALDAVIATGTPVVVVLSNGGVVSVAGWHDRVAAVMETWLLGQGGGAATAEVLFGVREPGGRLAETIPQRLEDTPAHRFFPGRDGHVTYGEGLFVGYRHHDSGGADPAYPFGHGLSYTSFSYSEPRVEQAADGSWRVSFEVSNTGVRAGSEVAQLYVRTADASADSPVHELRAFRKVRIEPGESEAITFLLEARDFSTWDQSLHRWRVEGGPRTLEVASSSRTVRGTVVVEVAADGFVRPIDEWATVGEWLDHPVGGPLLSEIFSGFGGRVAERAPEILRLVLQVPLIKMTTWGIGLTPDGIAEMTEKANETRA